MDLMGWGRPLCDKAELEVVDAARDGKLFYFFNAVGEGFPDNARDLVKTKAA